jgi:RNA polymerase sigma-70 factor, ECF subfamily
MEVQYAGGASAELTPELEFSCNREVLGEVFSRHKHRLYWTAFRVLGSREDAEDAMQDGLLAATRNWKSFEGRAQFSTWLTRIIVNAALDRRRRLRKHVPASIDQQTPDEVEISLAATITDPRPNPEEAYARDERLTMLKQRLEKLLVSQRSALRLRDIEGMTIQEAAEALHVSEGTLKSRLYRGRLQLSRPFRQATRSFAFG